MTAKECAVEDAPFRSRCFGGGAATTNSLRALVKHLGGLSDEEIVKVNIPTGAPLVYELDAELRGVRHRYLGDPAAIDAAMRAVAEQGRTAA